MARPSTPVALSSEKPSEDGGARHYCICDDGLCWTLAPGDIEWQPWASPIPGTAHGIDVGITLVIGLARGTGIP